MSAENKPLLIAIIDDDKFLLDMYATKFKANGFEVVAVAGGQDFLDKVREGFAPDVVLMDVVMPTVDGFQVVGTVRQENLIPKAKIIMLTNQNDPSEMAKAEPLGVGGYIVKANRVPSQVVEEVLTLIKN